MSIDPFMTAYSPFAGARLPELWEYLWLPEDQKSPVSAYVTVAEKCASPSDLRSYPPIDPSLKVRLAPNTISSPAGPSLLRRNSGTVVTGLYQPRTATVYELAPHLADLLTAGISVAEFARMWADTPAVHPLPGPPEAVLRSMLVNGVVTATGWDAHPLRDNEIVRCSGDTLVNNEADGSARILVFATGYRLKLSPGATAWWYELDGSRTATWLDANNAERSLFLELAGLGFISLERR
ncbi:hypothetical protein ABIA39_007192 [Nocardia sp. GAS34]|uniref:hypothetical protein n=1 Tax=unclassified Nocardia TaxID=2637762 RepID=UPI003D1D7228